jgi:hypothetical protein
MSYHAKKVAPRRSVWKCGLRLSIAIHTVLPSIIQSWRTDDLGLRSPHLRFYRKKEDNPVQLGSCTAFLVVILTSACASQVVNDQIPDGLINGVCGIELSRRIFEAEREMMRRLMIYSPIVETYIQSLWPDTTAVIPPDDVYFLGKVDFRKSSWQILNDNGQRWALYPAGSVSMLFVDTQDFDADTYRLKYLKRATLGTVSCLIFAVTLVKANESGRFNGTIWV